MSSLRCYIITLSSNYALTAVIFAVAVFSCVECSLPLTKPCGEIECHALEYCRQVDHQCMPCKEICESDSNNYDADRCVSDCQDHIHDERYLKLQNSSILELQRNELELKYKDLEKDVLILKIVVCVCVAVIAIVVAALLSFLAYFWKLMHPPVENPEDKKKSLNKSASATVSVELPTVYNNRYGVTTPTPENSPSSVVSISPADTNVTTLTSSTTVPPYSAGLRGGSPTKSESSIAATSPPTATTTLDSSASTAIYNKLKGGNRPDSVPPTNRFRREPSESTLPENCAYDNLSMSPQHYSHHV